MRVLLPVLAALVISCGGGGGGGGTDGVSAAGASANGSATSTSLVVNSTAAPEWGFANQADVDRGGADAGGSGTGAGTASGGSGSGSAGTASASAGDSSGVGSGGTGASASAGDAGDSGVGGVGGVASIIVNEVRYDTTGAVLRLRDAPRLQLGMTAKVNGPTNADFTAGQAVEVESAADALGVIASIDAASGDIAMTGITIGTDAITVWGNLSGLGSLSPGMTIQVWGLPAGAGRLRATRIEQRLSSASIVSGAVQDLDVAAGRFRIGSLIVDFSQSPPPAELANGVIVRVRAPAPSDRGVLRASAVELWYPVSLRTGTRRQLGGVVTDFEGISRFKVLGTPVDASLAQIVGGATALLLNGVELEVAGTVSNGVLVATKVRIKKTPGGISNASFTAKGTIGGFRAISDFKVKGQAIDASAAVIQVASGLPLSLGNGIQVTVIGNRIVNDVLIAAQIIIE